MFIGSVGGGNGISVAYWVARGLLIILVVAWLGGS